jgi:hypothetical protein
MRTVSKCCEGKKKKRKTLTPGQTVGFGGRAGSGTDDKVSGAYDMPICMDNPGQPASV